PSPGSVYRAALELLERPFFFLFLSFTDGHHLHSFPTRRSSDLFQFERVGYFVADWKDHAPGRLVFNRTVGLRDTWAKIESKASRDRKSTRLNSSHVANSYAVCCLKKKTRRRLRALHAEAGAERI